MPEHTRQILFGSLLRTQRGHGDCQEHRLTGCLLAYLVIVIFINPIVSVGNNLNQKKPTLTKPFCGIYCVYAAIKSTGKKVNITDLLKTKYIGSQRGSTLSELEKAARDNGLHVTPVQKLSSLDLKNCPHHVILHVKSEIGSERYDHYELFLGTKNAKAKLFNPPELIKSVPFPDLAPRWDGNGLIVSAEPIDLGSVFAPARKQFIVYAVVAIVIIVVLHGARRWLPETILNSRRKLLGLSAAQGAALGIAALLCGMMYHFANDEGLLANANATASIQQAHLGNFVPKISERKVHKLLDTNTVFIDARLARDYKAGHLEGAISVPVDANDVERQKATADILKDARIVLYCQSASCKFAEKVAIKLIDDAFSNVSIFKGGWAEWVEKNGKTKEASS